MKIKNLRKEIDKVDNQIVKLINRRFEIVSMISKESTDEDMTFVSDENMNEDGEVLPHELAQIFYKMSEVYKEKLGNTKERELLIGSKNFDKNYDFYNHFNLAEDESIMIAGPCAVENEYYTEQVAKHLKKRGVKFIRGGAYKPRTSPYEFQGLKEEGLKILSSVSKKYNLKVVTELVDTRDIPLLEKYADVVQIGARNMHNFELLKAVGKTNMPVLLKRGLTATIEEFVYAAEYIAKEGNKKIMLCERGIRTYETKTRNTLDISAVPIIKQETSLPIIVDLSHSLGRKDIIGPVGRAALAVGSNGIMVEVHPNPEWALSDRGKQLSISEFDELLGYIGLTEEEKRWKLRG